MFVAALLVTQWWDFTLPGFGRAQYQAIFLANGQTYFGRYYDRIGAYAKIEDVRNFVKLAYMSGSLHHSGGTICEPVDLPVNSGVPVSTLRSLATVALADATATFSSARPSKTP